MSGCGCEHEAQNRAQRRALAIALGLNAMMFVVGIVAGWLAHSSGLLADALDMLADATGYAVGLLAIGRGVRFKSWSTTLNGSLLLVLGTGVVIDAVRRLFEGHHPIGWIMVLIASVALLVNGSVLLFVLKPFRRREMFLRSFWLDTRADVIANFGVILSGLLVVLIRSPIPDLIIGIAIGAYVIKEAIEILREPESAGTTDS
ncbi:MAG: cation transporter [Xanthomonadaceae bacterium]|nr:cation transporter [Xanthomonadaceae bacterium]